MDVTLSQAEEIIMAAKQKAADINTKMNIAVVDSGANLVAFVRNDGAWLGSTDISIKKAKTAIFFQMDTADLSPLVQPGKPLFQIENSNNGLITFPGGVVLKNGAGEFIGAIGVSGSTVDDDATVAKAGAQALK
ncbi:MAG: heme-binding protein [Flavobacterium sp.]|uniref:GlcG/HbpS family heme-binding protein n=1 Tax=Flavobacterium sp. TaxID=239 RepID=UPI00120943E9|nr:heme-binding protein [Flavobacterium sp.]RZJ66150.1 MAG: heme-binding protein [Flavobacterium sp.]